MRLGGTAKFLCEVASRPDVEEAVSWAEERQLPIIMIGGGSNIIWRDEGFDGLIVVNQIMGYEQFDEDEFNSYIIVGAGENWDKVVEQSVSAGLSGIECLSLIPGTAGATPVQNVGAYGQEISRTLSSVEVYDLQEHKFINIPSEQCSFSYRNSRFKSEDKGRYLITGLTIHLTKTQPKPPFYGSVQQYFDEHGVHEYTPQALRNAVVAIRSAKLPDPAAVANNGSFFANPIVPIGTYTQIQANYEDQIPHWESDKGIKLSAAWLIEQAGYKGFHDSETGMMTWPNQPLVFVNENARNTADLLTFREKILQAVKEKFDITLEQEPELLP